MEKFEIEKFEITSNCESSLQIIAVISSIESILQVPVFLVGGAVRDLLLGETPKDLDFVTALTPDLVKIRLQNAGRKCGTQGQKFGTIGTRIINGNQFIPVEITTMRGEDYDQLTQNQLARSRKPAVNFITDLKTDLSRRDLTINAMAMNSSGQILDYFGGRQDLQSGIIRTVGDSKLRFREDPLRILRAIRLAAKLNFAIETKTWQRITKMKWEIFRVSKERWVMEIDRILVSKNVTKGLDLLMESGLLGLVVPELSLQKNYDQNSNYHDFDLWEHTLKVVENVPKENLELRWTALLHDIAKPFVRTNKNGKSNYIGHEILGSQMALKTCNYLKFFKVRTNFIVQNILIHLQTDSLLKPFDNAGKKTEPNLEQNLTKLEKKQNFDF